MALQAIYVRGKLSAVIKMLAIHPGDIRERLDAVTLDIVFIPTDGIPDFEGVAEDLEWIKAKLASKPSRVVEGLSMAATHGMPSTTATDIAERILKAHTKLDAYITAADGGST